MALVSSLIPEVATMRGSGTGNDSPDDLDHLQTVKEEVSPTQVCTCVELCKCNTNTEIIIRSFDYIQCLYSVHCISIARDKLIRLFEVSVVLHK